MKIRFLKLQNWFLAGIMGLFGLSACHSHKDVAVPDNDKPDSVPPDIHIVAPMYGVPARDWNNMPKRDSVNGPRDPEPVDPYVTVYGVPTVEFAVKGKVVDSQGKPISGIQVTLINSDIDPDNLPDNEYWEYRLREMADTTDAQGNFECRTTDGPWENVRVMVRDIDGKKNGLFETKVEDVEFDETNYNRKTGNNWRMGERNAEVTIKMKRK